MIYDVVREALRTFSGDVETVLKERGPETAASILWGSAFLKAPAPPRLCTDVPTFVQYREVQISCLFLLSRHGVEV